jgi:predicted nucleic acid-binding protein
MIIVSDTSPITNLIKIRQLSLLHLLYGELIIPPSVYDEILALQAFSIELNEFKTMSWIKIKIPQNNLLVKQLEIDLDAGESEAIVLAQELEASLLLIDERAGIRKAREMGLNAIGLLGILIEAKEAALIKTVKPILQDLINIAGFWISAELYAEILKISNENNNL